MTYVCSDLHGEYRLFLKLLDDLDFTKEDEMIVCGDIIDKGTRSVRLIDLLSRYKNFTFLIGNHEHDFLKYYDSLMRGSQDNYEEVLQKLREYFPGEEKLLTWEHVDWLESQPYFIEREQLICVHSGIPVLEDNTLAQLSKVSANQFVYDRTFKDPSVLPKTEKCVFFGHTPTNYITGKQKSSHIQKRRIPKP